MKRAEELDELSKKLDQIKRKASETNAELLKAFSAFSPSSRVSQVTSDISLEQRRNKADYEQELYKAQRDFEIQSSLLRSKRSALEQSLSGTSSPMQRQEVRNQLSRVNAQFSKEYGYAEEAKGRARSSFEEQNLVSKQRSLELGEAYGSAQSIFASGDKGAIKEALQNTNSPQEKLIADYLKQILDEEKKTNKSLSPLGETLVAGLRLNNLYNLGKDVAGLTRSQNGLDMLPQTGGLLGQGIGYGVGAVGAVGATMMGAPEFAPAMLSGGAALGQFIGQTTGELEKRAFDEQIGFLKNYRQFNNLGGSSLQDESGLGISLSDQTSFQLQLSKARGKTGNDITAGTFESFNRLLGVDPGTMFGLANQLRTGSSGDLYGTTKGLFERGQQQGLFTGSDKAFFNEFLQEFKQLNQEFRKVGVPEGKVADIMFGFNKIGGQFDLRNENALGNIQTAQSILTNPQSDVAKSLQFLALRQSHPGATPFEMEEIRQQGFGDAKYARSYFTLLKQMSGGNDQFRLSLLNQGLSAPAARQFADHFDEIFSLPESEQKKKLQSMMSQKDFEGQAVVQQQPLENLAAQIKNGFLQGSKEGIDAVFESLKTSVAQIFAQPIITINIDNNGKVSVTTNVKMNAMKGQAAAQNTSNKTTTMQHPLVNFQGTKVDPVTGAVLGGQ